MKKATHHLDEHSPKVWFISDTHFGHENIIQFCKRPFCDAAEMNEHMTAIWKATISKHDTVYHLGDIGKFKSDADGKRFMDALPGHKHLIIGNHDNSDWNVGKATLGTFESISDYGEIAIKEEGWGTYHLRLCHYPMASWNGSFSGGTFNLHGHCHGHMPSIKGRLDVGVDGGFLNQPWYAPRSWADIRTVLQQTLKLKAGE